MDFFSFVERFNTTFAGEMPMDMFGIGLAISSAFFIAICGVKVLCRVINCILDFIEKKMKGAKKDV